MTSKLLSAVVVCLLATSLFAGSAAAVESQPRDLPEEAEVGSDVETTFELTELFDEFEAWTLRAETELREVTWTVWYYDQAGNQVDQQSVDGQELATGVDIDDGVSRIEVRVTGTAPEIGNYSYDPPERFVMANLSQTRTGGTERTIDSYEVHHYTQESKEARNAIDAARERVAGSGSDSGQALLESAISSYEGGDFESASRDAERAGKEGSQSKLLRNAAIGVGGVLSLVLVVGGGYRFYRSRQQSPSRLK
jgi:hypothetical protein